MKTSSRAAQKQFLDENEKLRARLEEAEETLRAIRSGEVDALVVASTQGDQIFTLQSADHPYRVLFQDMQEGALTLTEGGMILYANRAYAEMVKTSLERVIGSNFHDWIGLECWEGIQQQMQQVSRQKYGEEQALIASDGTRVPVYLSVNHLSISESSSTLCVVVTDLTQRKKVEEALIRANRAKDDFLANVSHELRTPLTGIMGLSESLLAGLYGGLTEQQKKTLKTVYACGEHLLSLINEILDVSQIESGRLELQPENFDVNEVCLASLAYVKHLAAKKSIKMLYVSSPYDTTLLADPKRIRQVLVNLLNNAVKFTPEKGTVTLEVDPYSQPGWMCFSVTDTGIGIAPEDLKKLFKPFVQLDSGLDRQYEGSGLGLVIVKQLVELHGGQMEVQSTPGQGSRFSFILPWSPEDQFP
jgi:PAS domain S-box-containing protein